MGLTWLHPGQPFPDPNQACADAIAPGLLAAGADLSVPTLLQAYSLGVFPWFSAGQPILWWCPDPRMVLPVDAFRLHPSLRKTLRKVMRRSDLTIRLDHDFSAVIRACAQSPRQGQSGTWIVPEMIDAYCALHAQGWAHSVEVHQDGRLIAGLYCVAIGGAVFGESMFTTVRDASKIALAALVALCRGHQVTHIDCQQNTRHLASLGAHEMPRDAFRRQVATQCRAAPLDWTFSPVYWNLLLSA